MFSYNTSHFIVKLPLGFHSSILKYQKLVDLVLIYKSNFFILRAIPGEFLIFKNKSFLILLLESKFNLSLYRVLNQILKGFLDKWNLCLSLNGVGFKFLEVNSKKICVKLGYSHVIKYFLPQHIAIKVSKRKPTKLILFSSNKQLLSQVAIIISKMRNPDVYKAKGIQFFKEVIVLKKREKFGVF